MKVGLIGFLGSGKSTLYRAAAGGQAKGDVTAVPVPDPRFDAIVHQVKPKKVTPATVIMHDDIDDAAGTGKMFSAKALEAARKMDLLLHVVRAFESPTSAYHASVDPLRDEEAVSVELVLADLQMVETRLEKLIKSPGAKTSGSAEYLEKVAFERFKGPLEEGTPIRALELTDDEETVVKNFQLLSAKPMVVAFNVVESELAAIPSRLAARMAELEANATPAFVVSAPIEEEIASLDPEDRPEFLASLGITEPAGALVIQAVYRAMGLHTFFTAGENETRAWTMRIGESALKAASVIHTDIAKGFIRAEVVHYDDYAVAGSLDAAYSSGKMHLQGKDFVIKDGDLLHIRTSAK
jgi:GTP-binding protein YchF